jgi:hypothetical protein
MLKVDDTAKSDAVAREAEGSGWCVEIEDDQRKLGWWAKYAVLAELLMKPVKNIWLIV